jgi:dUTP pyrophosphatase
MSLDGGGDCILYVRFKKLTETAHEPTHGSSWAAGYDLYADIPYTNNILIKPGGIVVIKTNIAVEIPAGYFGGIYPRSGLSTKQGLTLINCVGVVDADYRGDIRVPLINLSQSWQIIEPGERVAQLIIQPCKLIQWAEVKELSDTDRGSGGFGSTGRT